MMPEKYVGHQTVLYILACKVSFILQSVSKSFGVVCQVIKYGIGFIQRTTSDHKCGSTKTRTKIFEELI